MSFIDVYSFQSIPYHGPTISNVDNGGIALSADSCCLADRSKHSVEIIEGIIHSITNEKLRKQAKFVCDIRANFIGFRIVRRETVSFSSVLPQFKHPLLKPAYTSYLVFMWELRERGGEGIGNETYLTDTSRWARYGIPRSRLGRRRWWTNRLAERNWMSN